MSTRDDISRLCSSFFRMDSPIPYEIDENGANTYMRWTTDDVNPVFIRKVTVTGNIISNTYTVDLWANRATATYYYNMDNMV